MVFDFIKLIIILISLGLSIFIIIHIKNNMLKVLAVTVELGFFIYSGIGLALFDIDRSYHYLIQYVLSSLGIALVFFLFQGNYNSYIKAHYNADELVFDFNKSVLPKSFSVIYLLTFVFPFLYPSFDILRVFDFTALFDNYHALSSTYKLQLQNDSIYQLVCSTIRTLCLPWFYVYLFKIRHKPLLFSILFLIPVYLYAVSNYYISRNEIAVFAVFLYTYFYREKVFSKKTLKAAAVIGVPVLMAVFSAMFYLRVGDSINTYNVNGLITDLILKETNFVQNYPKAAVLSDEINPIMFYLYVLTCFIPMSLRSIIGIEEINLARVLSNNLLNMSYGDRDYYLILPSVLGEGIMVFDEYFCFLYVLIFAFLLIWFLKRISRDESLQYLAIYFIIDVFRQLRGGGQFIISAWMAAFIPFIVVCYCANRYILKKRA